MRSSRLWSGLIILAASAVGVMAFLYPFFSLSSDEQVRGLASQAHANDAPLILLVLVGFCLGAIMSDLSSGKMNSKMVAVLGILVAVNGVLRAVPGPAGFSAIFMLPVLTGYVYGGTFGFLLGSLSILVSALIGAGVGPWVPYQMFAAGWIGMLSSWLPDMRRLGRWEAVVLALWGLFLGLLYGIVMNIWFWPYVMAPQNAEMYWSAGLGLWDTLKRYAAFYMVTSLWWDMGRAGGNFLLLLLFALPILKILRRFQLRFNFLRAPDTKVVREGQ